MQAWRTFEDRVRAIAALRWGKPCHPGHAHGVDFDGIVNISGEEMILIEITTEFNLGKVRDDVNKIAPFRLAQLAKGIFCRGFVVLNEEPTNSMREFGEGSHIRVCSLKEFEQEFFDFSSYMELRAKEAFGSAVDSKTGLNDSRQFVPVGYKIDGSKADLSVDDIAAKLIRGAKITLTGDYGTGKSRCVRETFFELSKKITEAGAYPIAINLRDHWSSSNALEILAGHLGNIGLQGSVDNMVRLLNAGALILLLDGFDEIGTQVYDPRARDRKALRKHAVRGLRDLIQRARSGVLLTGRSHFFDSDDEMLESIGMANGHSVVLARVPDYFTEAEASKYLAGLDIDAPIPHWLPRKPLVFQLLAEIGISEVKRLLTQKFGEFEFWGAFLYAVCIRESKGVAESVSAETVKDILLELSVRSRYSQTMLGRLSPKEIDDAYEAVVASSPDETGRLLLARLCTLGRIEPESPDRQFIDQSLVDALRAEHLVTEVSAMSDQYTARKWQQGLRILGAVYAANLVDAYGLHNSCFAYLRKYATCANTWMLGEIVSILSIAGTGKVDFQSLQILNGYIPILSLHKKALQSLAIKDSEIFALDIDRTTVTAAHDVLVDGCIIDSIFGISGQAGMPEWIVNSEVIHFDQMSNAAAIKESDIHGANKLLLAVIHKIFFQHGSGREEASLRKGGYGQEYSAKLVGKILNLLMREGVVERAKGDEGWIYRPVRSATPRMSKIRSELSLSTDPIWKEVGTFKD